MMVGFERIEVLLIIAKLSILFTGHAKNWDGAILLFYEFESWI